MTARRGIKGGSARDKKVRVKTGRGRKPSSTRWLQRQLNDPYVADARRAGYRSRAAWKLVQLDDRFRFLKPGTNVVDLGAAPGGWTQVSVERVQGGRVVGVDVLPMDGVAGATILCGDMTEMQTSLDVEAALDGKANVVLSDMAAPTTGHRPTDHLRTIALCEIAADFANDVLAPGGVFVAKVFQGGAESELLTTLKARFEKVQHVKPDASRKESPETYLIAMGYRGHG